MWLLGYKQKVDNLLNRVENLEATCRQLSCKHPVLLFEERGVYFVGKCKNCDMWVEVYPNAELWNKAQIKQLKSQAKELQDKIDETKRS